MNSINEMTKWNSWFNYSNAEGCEVNTLKSNDVVHSSYYFIFDCLSNRIVYTCDCFERVLGYSKDDFSFLEMISFMHPDDCNYVLECERKAVSFISELSEDDIFKFSISYSYRSLTRNGVYIRVRQNYQALELNKHGKMTRMLVFNDVVDGADRCIDDDFEVLERQTNNRVILFNELNLTKREVEVLALIKEGLTSVEISNKLHVSKFTVDTHRKNILAKANSRKFITMVG